MKKWSLGDIIDFEYFFYRDAAADTPEDRQLLQERDRRIYLDAIRPGLKPGKTPDRRLVILTWLSRRRQEEAAQTTVLPGEGFESLYGSCRILFILAGLVLGGGAGLSLLSYAGDRPVNVFVYLLVFVFSQVLLLLLLFALSVYRLQRGTLSFSPLYRAIGRFILGVLLRIRSRVSRKMGAASRTSTESIMGLLVSRGRTYGLLFFLPFFSLTQLFGLGFNLGLLAITLFKVITADIAFGWQSTLQLSPAAVHGLVQQIALPWSWLVGPGLAHPSPDQIEGSRIILKEGIYHLSTPDLASWWPFLCFSVLFYGLLPRFLLFLSSAVLQQRLLKRFNFRQGNYEQLLLRLTTPLVTTHGRGPGEFDQGPAAELDYGSGRPAAAAGTAAADHLLVLVPADVSAGMGAEDLKVAVLRRFNAAAAEIISIGEEYDTDAAVLAELEKRRKPESADILLIQEAWQPPIAEYLDFIKNLRIALGHGPCIRIGLIGKPRPDNIFTPAQEENRKIWTRKINGIGDPCIYVTEC